MSVSRTVSKISASKEWSNLETECRGHSRSLKMVPIDRTYMIFYWSVIAIIALSCTVFELFDVDNIVTLKSGLEVTQGHSNWYHLKAWVRFPVRLP